MSRKTIKLPPAVQSSLEDFDKATEMLDNVMTASTLETKVEAGQSLAEIKEKMHKPSWKLITHNLLEGIYHAQPLTLQVLIEFALDTQTLIEYIDTMTSTNTNLVKKVTSALLHKPESAEVAEILEEASLPHAYGISTRIQVIKKTGPAQEITVDESFMDMVIDSDLVHCQWAELINKWLPIPLVLNKQKFRQECWVNWEFLLSDKKFNKNFFWTDGPSDQPLQITIETEWQRI